MKTLKELGVIPEERKEAILDKIRKVAREEYSRVKEWTHGLLHVEEVVEHIKVLAEEEGVNPFYAEITGWLHDIGRAQEKKGVIGEKSDHAHLSSKAANRILRQFEDEIPIGNRSAISEAIATHSQPVLLEYASKLARILQDADRGAGMGYVGVLRGASFVAEVEGVLATNNEEVAKNFCETNLLDVLKSDQEKRQAVIEHCGFMKKWYSGLTEGRSWIVKPMNTTAGRKRFKPDYSAIKNYRERLLAL